MRHLPATLLLLILLAITPLIHAQEDLAPRSSPSTPAPGMPVSPGMPIAPGGPYSHSHPRPVNYGPDLDLSLLFAWFIVFVLCALLCYTLAREKGHNTTLAAIVGFIPVLNFFALVYLVGAKDLHMDAKLNKILTRLQDQPPD